VHSLRRIAVLGALASLVVAVPAASAAVPSRVQTKLDRASAAVGRASSAIDDGDNAKGIAALKAIDRNLVGAANAAKKHVADSNGPDSFGAVEDGTHEAVGEIAGLFDGVTDTDTVNQLGTTLKDALTARDGLVSAIGGLSADQRSGYADVLNAMNSNVADEIDAVQQALSDDTLKDPEAKDALNAALTQLKATASAVQSLLSGLGTSTPSGSNTPAATPNQTDRNGDCPHGQMSDETDGPQPRVTVESTGEDPGDF
jgi:hypothetical protein